MPFVNQIPEALGFPDWRYVPNSLVKMPPKMVANPAPGAGVLPVDPTKPNGPKIPALIASGEERWQAQFKTPEGPIRQVELTSPDITERGLQVG